MLAKLPSRVRSEAREAYTLFIQNPRHNCNSFPMNKETLKYLLADFHEKPFPDAFNRKVALPLDPKKIITVVGIRRSGKTYLLYLTMRRLTERGLDKRNIIYLNFEDDRLFPVRLSEMDLILKAYHELYPDKLEEEKVLFLDEIQQIPDWEKYIRRIYDTESVHVYLTGSSSKTISRDISTTLRGRAIHYELFPLSFGECLDFKGIEIKRYSTATESRMLHALHEYLQWGGFPEVVMEEDPHLRWKILQEYADLILYKDLIEQYGIKNQYLLKYLLKHFMTNPSDLVSINKLYNDLKSQGVSLSKGSLYEYIEYLQAAYILFSTSKYSRSLRVRTQNPSKYYIVDTGLTRIFTPNRGRDMGKKLENAIFLYLRTQWNIHDISYYKNQFEIDFFYDEAASRHLINVSYSVQDMDTAGREVRGLTNVKKAYPDASDALVLNDWDPNLIPETIRVIPAWQFLLFGFK